MSELKERIRELRKALKMSQTKFGESLGAGLGVIKNLETGLTELKPAMADLIVEKYKVNRLWLETGDGEMFQKLTREEHIAEFISKALTDESDDFKKNLIMILASLDEVGWYKLKEAAKALKEAEEKSRSE